MALSDFVPQIWSARFTTKLRDALVWGSVMNANYEGEIQAAGDTVKIPTSTTTITVRDYTESTDIADAQEANGTTQDLLIDKQKYFHFYVDDIHEAQTRPELMDDAMGEAAFQMANQQDDDYATTIQSAYDVSRNTAVSVAMNAADNGYDIALLQAFTATAKSMDEANVPQEDRWAIVSPFLKERLTNRFAIQGNSAGVYIPATSEQSLRNGFIGNLFGFRLLSTNKVQKINIATNPHDRFYLGQGTGANTRAEQLVSIEAYRPEKRFGDAVKGLRVYGSKNVHANRIWTISARTG